MIYLHKLFGKILIRFTTYVEKPKRSAAAAPLQLEVELYREKVPVEILKEQIPLETEHIAHPGDNPLGEEEHEREHEQEKKEDAAPEPASDSSPSVNDVFTPSSIPSLASLQQPLRQPGATWVPVSPTSPVSLFFTPLKSEAPSPSPFITGSFSAQPSLMPSWSAIVAQTRAPSPPHQSQLEQHRPSTQLSQPFVQQSVPVNTTQSSHALSPQPSRPPPQSSQASPQLSQPYQSPLSPTPTHMLQSSSFFQASQLSASSQASQLLASSQSSASPSKALAQSSSGQAKAVQVVVRVMDEKKQPLIATREKRISQVNILFEKVARKGRTGIVLVADSVDVIEPSSTATFGQFLKVTLNPPFSLFFFVTL